MANLDFNFSQIRFDAINQRLQYAVGTNWVDVPEGGGTPSGADTEIQFNDDGAFGASESLTWDEGNTLLRVPNISGQPDGDLVLGGFDGANSSLTLPADDVVTLANIGGSVLISNGHTWTHDSQGFLGLPSVNDAQRDGMTATAGALIYNSTTNKLNFYNGAAWEVVTSATV